MIGLERYLLEEEFGPLEVYFLTNYRPWKGVFLSINCPIDPFRIAHNSNSQALNSLD